MTSTKTMDTPQKSQSPGSLQRRNSSSNKQLLSTTPQARLLTTDQLLGSSQPTQSTLGLPVDHQQHQVSHCRHFAIRGKQATCLKQPPKQQEGNYVVFSIQAAPPLSASKAFTCKSNLNSPPPSLVCLTMRLFLFPLLFATLFPTSPFPPSPAQLLFCHHHWNCFQSCWLLP